MKTKIWVEIDDPRKDESVWTADDVTTALKHMYVRAVDRGVKFEAFSADQVPEQQTLDLGLTA